MSMSLIIASHTDWPAYDLQIQDSLKPPVHVENVLVHDHKKCRKVMHQTSKLRNLCGIHIIKIYHRVQV